MHTHAMGGDEAKRLQDALAPAMEAAADLIEASRPDEPGEAIDQAMELASCLTQAVVAAVAERHGLAMPAAIPGAAMGMTALIEQIRDPQISGMVRGACLHHSERVRQAMTLVTSPAGGSA